MVLAKSYIPSLYHLEVSAPRVELQSEKSEKYYSSIVIFLGYVPVTASGMTLTHTQKLAKSNYIICKSVFCVFTLWIAYHIIVSPQLFVFFPS